MHLDTTALRRLSAPLSGLILAGAVLFLYGRFVRHPDAYFVGDLVSYYQPVRHYYAQCLTAGELPLWTPALFAGTPMIADAQLGAFYPPTLIHLGVGFPLAELVEFLAHVILGGLGMLWLSRRLGLRTAPALFAALGFALSGFFAAHLMHPNFIYSAAWLPWLLGALHAVVHRGGPRTLAWAALFVGLSVLAGGLQLVYYGFAFALILATVWALTAADLDHRTRLVRLAAVGGAFALGMALCAVQLLPTGEFAGLSIRAHGVTLDVARSYRLPARQALHLIVPYLFGLQGRTPWVAGQDFYEAFGYFGVLCLPLAVAALRRRDSLAVAAPRWALAAVALLSLVAATGPEGIVDLHHWLFRLAPGFDRFRAPGRLLYLVQTAGVLLAATGLQDLLSTKPDRAAAARTGFTAGTLVVLGGIAASVLFTAGAPAALPKATAALARQSALGATAVVLGAFLLVAGGSRLRVRGTGVAAGLVALHALDLLVVGRLFVGATAPPAGTDVARLAHRPPPAIDANPRTAHHDQRVLYAPGSFFMLQNAGLLHGYDNLRSYSPVMLRRTYDLLYLADHGTFAPWKRLPVDHNLIMVSRVHTPVVRLLGVRYVLRHDRPRAPPGVRRDLRWRVQTLRDPLPRAFVVYRTALAPARRDQERIMRTFDPGREAVVETPDAQVPGVQRSYGRGRVLHRSRCTGAASIQAEVAEAHGLLVFTEGWHPGWEARVDGKPVKVHRVDHGLIGVKLPRGPHRVELRFCPRSLTRGALLSAVAVGVLLLLWLVPWIRRRAP